MEADDELVLEDYHNIMQDEPLLEDKPVLEDEQGEPDDTMLDMPALDQRRRAALDYALQVDPSLATSESEPVSEPALYRFHLS